MKNAMVAGAVALMVGLGARGAVNWDDALVVGHTNGDKCFYKAGEEIVFTLELKGVKGEIPPGEFFLDWERSANDGKTERGRVAASLEKPLVIRTKMDVPGFVKIEANLVDKTGRRVPKKHMWEKRVFFQGGAGVDVDKIPAWPEPKDYDAHWAANRKLIDELPLKVLERTPLPCANPKLNLWRIKLNAPEGVRPATGYLAIPKDASAANRVKATGILSGYYNFAERCPSWLTNVVAGIRMYINRHGCEVDQPEAYYQQFFQPWPLPQKHFRDMALRGMQMFRYLKTLPEWNGKDLIAFGSSGGAMQTFWMAMVEPAISKVDATSAANADVFGFKYGRATCGLAQRDEALNYYDICNAAKRVKCPVVMNAGLGDYTCPPAGLSIVYRNLRCKKQITWSQGCTHGWWPAGMKKETWSSGAAEASRAGVAELTAGTGGTADPLAKMRPLTNEELAKLVAEDVAKPVRPGGVGGQPFWNGSSYLFMYPPAFEFKSVAGAVRYRFVAIDDIHRTHEMTAEKPTASLTPMWGQIPAGGLVTVVCEGLDAKGTSRGLAGMRRFWKTVPFRPGAYKPAARPYAEAAARACEYIWSLPNTKRLLEKGEPDPDYSLNCYPAKMNAAVVRAMLRYAKLRPERAADARKVACAAADYLIGISQPEGAPLAHFPPTYRGSANTAKDYAGQNMLLYPATAALAYLELAEATGAAKYRTAAERIGRTYLRLQGADGTWPLKVWEKDGKSVQANRAFPMTPMELFEKLYDLTRDAAWRTAADRAFASIEKGPLANWNWDCQFEDVNPQTAYKSLSKHNACSTAIYLLKRFPGDAKRLAQARELLRFSEDQFVYWEKPCRLDGTGHRTGTPEGKGIIGWLWDYRKWHTPGVGEQYGWEMPIDASNDKLIRTYLALYAAERNPLDLAKARALGDALVNIQDAKGCIRTQMLMRPDADSIWINCLGATVDALDLLAAAVGSLP